MSLCQIYGDKCCQFVHLAILQSPQLYWVSHLCNGDFTTGHSPHCHDSWLLHSIFTVLQPRKRKAAEGRLNYYSRQQYFLFASAQSAVKCCHLLPPNAVIFILFFFYFIFHRSFCKTETEALHTENKSSRLPRTVFLKSHTFDNHSSTHVTVFKIPHQVGALSSREIPSCWALDLAEIRRSSKISS